jgi:tripartite-type tricarboxylate transporter receptor subunit TctC
VATASLISLVASSGLQAQTALEFYRNKQIRMIVGHAAGNDYDLAARFLARYLAKHIPGEPTIIVQNMPAAAMKLDMTYRPPDALERLLARLYETPPELVDTVKKLVPNMQ